MYSSTERIMKLYEIVFYTADHSMMMRKFLFSFCVLNVLKKHVWHVFSIFDMSRTEDFNNVCVVNEIKNIEFLTFFKDHVTCFFWYRLSTVSVLCN